MREPTASRLYLVIETFRPGCRDRVYARYEEKGRLLPDGIAVLDSWVTRDGARCYQLMEAADATAFGRWFERWSDLVDFELVPVERSPTMSREGHRASD